MKNLLLVIGCSQRKVKTSEPLAAVELYDGPTYRCLRKMCRGERNLENVDVLIISAKYGLLTAHQPIYDYDQHMTLHRSDELRPDIQDRLKHVISSKEGGYDEVFVNLGKTYMKTLEGFDWGEVSILEASGGIGQKTSQMKAWLEKLSEPTAVDIDAIHYITITWREDEEEKLAFFNSAERLDKDTDASNKRAIAELPVELVQSLLQIARSNKTE